MTRLIEVWLLPPGIFILLLAAVAVRAALLARRRERGSVDRTRLQITCALTVAVAVGLWALSTGAVSNRLIRPLEERYPAAVQTELNRVDAVIVLGGGVVARGNGELSAEALARLVSGLTAARAAGVPLVVTGGRPFAGEEVPTEGSVAAAQIERLGGNPAGVIVEEVSRTTAENALFTSELVDLERVALATSAWHMPRALVAFEAYGFSPVALPGPWRSDRRRFHPIALLPNAGALETSSLALRERLGLLWYQLTL